MRQHYFQQHLATFAGNSVASCMVHCWRDVAMLCCLKMLPANRLPLYSSATVAVNIKEADSFVTSVQAQQTIYIIYLHAIKLKSSSKVEAFIRTKF